MKKQLIHVLLLCAGFLIQIPQALAVGVGEAAPPLSARYLSDKSPVDLNALKGKVVYIDFWASWCGPCAQSFPLLNKVYHEFKDQGFEIVAVSVDKHREDVDAFLARHPVDFKIAVDPIGESPKRYNLLGMPSSYLIDKNGVVQVVKRGFNPGHIQPLRNNIEKLLAQ